MIDNTIDATELAKTNYTEYSTYVAQGRAYPCITDGAKSSYKRAIYGMYLNKSNKIVKVAELAAHALPYHPHPTSISGVIVQLGDEGNKLKLMDTQGNWGDSSRKIEPSAERYIGGKLSLLAEHLLCDSIDYCRTIKGEIDKDEPAALPALIPLCFINGLQGIPSGLPTLNIPTIDIIGMIDYYIEILTNKDVNYKPKKYPKPNLEVNVTSTLDEWNAILSTGRGTLKTAPTMTIEGNVITITALPRTKNVDHVRKVIEKEILLDKVDLRDETAEDLCIVVEKVPHKQCDMKELYKRLYTKLQSSETYNMAFFDEEKIYVPCSFDKVVRTNIQYLIDTHTARIDAELVVAKNKLKILQIIEHLKKKNLVKPLFDLDYDGAVSFIVNNIKDITATDASKVLQKPISYLTKEHYKEIEDLEAEIAQLENNKINIFDFLITKYKAIKKEISSAIKNKFKPTKFVKA